MKTYFIYAKLATSGTCIHLKAKLINQSPKGYYHVSIINAENTVTAILNSLPKDFHPPKTSQPDLNGTSTPSIQSSF
jgi:hypothetical protein